MSKMKRIPREQRIEDLHKYALHMWVNMLPGLRKRELPRSKACQRYMDAVSDAVVALYDWTIRGCPEDENQDL